MRVNFTKAEDVAVVPDGKYTCEIEDVEERTSENGNPIWRITLQVADGDLAGRHIYDTIAIVDQSLWRLKQLYTACGLLAQGEMEIAPPDIIGKTVVASVVQREFSGEKRSRVKRYEQPAPPF